MFVSKIGLSHIKLSAVLSILTEWLFGSRTHIMCANKIIKNLNTPYSLVKATVHMFIEKKGFRGFCARKLNYQRTGHGESC